MKELTGITLFSGLGGSAYGFKLAGIKDLYFNDFEKHAIDCLKANYPGLPDKAYDNRSIYDVKGKEVLDIIGLKKGELDFLQMSPPCQDFSNLNTKVGAQQITVRSQLYAEGLRIAKELMPKVIIIENVSGFLNNFVIFTETLGDLEDMGYKVDAWNLESGYYGCTQNRPRAWVVAYRADVNKTPTKPNQISTPTPLRKVLDYIEWIFTPQFGGVLLPTTKPMPTITKTPNIQFVEKIESLAKINENQFVKDGNFSVGTSSYDIVDDDNWLIPVDLQRMTEKMLQELGVHKNKTMYKLRWPTVDELKILSDLPTSYVIPGESHLKAWNRIGNMVLPIMLKTLCLHIRDELSI